MPRNGNEAIIGVDIGFGYAKWFAKGPPPGSEYFDLFPSYIGESITQRASGVRGLDALTGPRSFLVTLNGVRRLIGENAAIQSRTRIGAMNETRFGDAETVQLFTLSAMESYLRVAPSPRWDFLVVTGIPLASYLNYRPAVTEALTRTIAYNYNGEPRTVHTNVVVLPAPLGPYFDFLMDESGNAPKNRIFERVGIVVIGTLTTEFSLIVGGARPQPVDEKSGSIHVGLDYVTSRIRRFLKDSHNVEANHFDIDQTMLSDKFVFGGIDYRGVAASATDEAGKAIADHMQTLWGTGKELDAVLVSGGASRWISPAVQRVFQHHNYIETPNPIFSTARGYWKYGAQLQA